MWTWSDFSFDSTVLVLKQLAMAEPKADQQALLPTLALDHYLRSE
jgi:hypothetical protein